MSDTALAAGLRDPAALILAITHLPFGLSALAHYMRAEAEIGPLTAGFEDLLLDNLPLTQAQAKAIAAVYRQLPWVARAIDAERGRIHAVTHADSAPPCIVPTGHEFGRAGMVGGDGRLIYDGRKLCIHCGEEGDA